MPRICQLENARVNIEYRVDFEKHFYSVPFELIHQEVQIRASEHCIEIFYKSKAGAIATHPRNRTPGRYSTQAASISSSHQ